MAVENDANQVINHRNILSFPDAFEFCFVELKETVLFFGLDLLFVLVNKQKKQWIQLDLCCSILLICWVFVGGLICTVPRLWKGVPEGERVQSILYLVISRNHSSSSSFNRTTARIHWKCLAKFPPTVIDPDEASIYYFLPNPDCQVLLTAKAAFGPSQTFYLEKASGQFFRCQEKE